MREQYYLLRAQSCVPFQELPSAKEGCLAPPKGQPAYSTG